MLGDKVKKVPPSEMMQLLSKLYGISEKAERKAILDSTESLISMKRNAESLLGSRSQVDLKGDRVEKLVAEMVGSGRVITSVYKNVTDISKQMASAPGAEYIHNPYQCFMAAEFLTGLTRIRVFKAEPG